MKKLFYFIFTLTLFIGCTEDEEIVTEIQIDKRELTIKLGEKHQFTVSHSPSNLTAPEYQWESENTSIATVNSSGEIEAKGLGTTKIIVTAKALGLTSECNLNVVPIDATSIQITSEKSILEVGEEITLKAVISPENATFKDVEWKSNDENIVSINSKGTVTAISDGTATITANIKETKISATFEITINPIRVSGISLKEKNISLEHGMYHTIEAEISPIDAKDQQFTLKSTDDNIITINNNTIYAKNIGECEVIVTSNDGGFTDVCKITVIPASVIGIELPYQTFSILNGSSHQFTCTVQPEIAANKNVYWTSSNEDILTVNENGMVTAHNLGSANIWVVTQDGDFKASCAVTVKEITAFIDLKIRKSSIVNINGSITGGLYSEITNNSPDEIELTKFEIVDYYGRIIAQTTDPDKLGKLLPGNTTNLGMQLNSVYYPSLKWYFKHHEKSYSVSHQYESSYPW